MTQTMSGCHTKKSGHETIRENSNEFKFSKSKKRHLSRTCMSCIDLWEHAGYLIGLAKPKISGQVELSVNRITK